MGEGGRGWTGRRKKLEEGVEGEAEEEKDGVVDLFRKGKGQR